MAILRHLFSAFIAIALVGCYEDFTPNIDVTPVLCLNSLITAGEPVEVDITRTFLYTDEQESHNVDDAVVSIYVNGERVNADYLPQQGDMIRIEAVSPKFGRAEGEVRVPYAVPIQTVNFYPKVIDSYISDDEEMYSNVQFDFDADLKFKDAPDIENYYKFDYAAIDPITEPNVGIGDDGEILWTEYSHVWFYIGSFQADREPIFGEHIGAMDAAMGADSYGFTFFTDRQFPGTEYTLHLSFTACHYQINSMKWQPGLLDASVKLTLSTISRSLYDWANCRWQSEQGIVGGLGEFGLADPIWGYSNVSTGAGIIAARAVSEYTICLADFLREVFQR